MYRWFYNYDVNAKGRYNKYVHGVASSDDENINIYEEVLADARKRYPDADNINIKALNRI